MAESRVTSNQLEVLSSSNHSRVTSVQLEVLTAASTGHSRVSSVQLEVLKTGVATTRLTSVQLEVLTPIWKVSITGVAAPPTGIDITVSPANASGVATSYDVHAELTPGVTPGPGNLIGSFPAGGLPQVLSLLGLNVATYYFLKVVENNPHGTLESNEIIVETGGYGTPPLLTVGNIDNTSAVLSVQLDPQYTDVHYILTIPADTYYTAPVFEISDSSGARWSVQATPLVFGTTYKVKANWLGPLGWSGYSNEVTFVTASVVTYADYKTIIRPKFGESVRGSSYQITWPPLQGGETATLEISDDLGLSWSTLATGLVGTAHTFNPSLYTDGQDYLLRLTGDMGTSYLQLCFYIDNAFTGTNYWHDTGNWNVDIYDPAQFAEGLYPSGRWHGHISGYQFALVEFGGGTNPTALITKAIRRHTDVDVTTTALIDSGEGSFWWNRYWAAEFWHFGVVGLLSGLNRCSAYIYTSMFWPFAAWPYIYAPCGPEKGTSTTSVFVVDVTSLPMGRSFQVMLPRIHARVRTCPPPLDNPNYNIRLKVTHPDRVGTPHRIRLRGTVFGLSLRLPSTFVDDYWLIDEEFDLVTPFLPGQTFPLDCGCAGPYGMKFHGSADLYGRAEFETIGASVMATDCLLGPALPCAGVPIAPPLIPPSDIPGEPFLPPSIIPGVTPVVCPIEPCPGNYIVTEDDDSNDMCK